jgi:predicted AAA+ superfamily ATPase
MTYIHRNLEGKAKELFQKFPILAVLGPRQSGKTTMVRSLFQDKPYFNMENPNHYDFASQDPVGFLNSQPNGMIIDEVQNVPNLFSYLQVISDEKGTPGQYILTGSHNILLNEKISQSLAGRVALCHLLPFCISELPESRDFLSAMYKGFYPRLHMQDIDPVDYYPNYISTYVEKDVRQIANLIQLSTFKKFIRLCAGRVGQILNMTSLATETGISLPTVKDWLSILEMSYIIFPLQPYYKNFNKQVVKSPKLYFCDTGLLCNLLGLTTPESLELHYAKGSIFENMIVADIYKTYLGMARQPKLYFWRDKNGHEVDLLIDTDQGLLPVEIKSGQTITTDYFTGIKKFQDLADCLPGIVTYAGSEEQQRSNHSVIPWNQIAKAITS